MNSESKKEILLKRVLENKGIIIKVCNSYCKNKFDREDLAQEIIYQLWKSGHQYNPTFSLSTWIYRIALNVAISYYRKSKREVISLPIAENNSEIEYNTESREDEDEKLQNLQRFIFELKEIDKALILLYLEGKSYSEIATITGISETNTATRISRIKDKLKQKFSTQTL